MSESINNNNIPDYFYAPEFLPLVLRYILCISLTKEHDDIPDPSEFTHSTDVITLNGCLNALGLTSKKTQNKKNVHTLICGGSACAMGLLMPIAAAFGKNCLFLADESLLEGSLGDFLKTLKVHGIRHEFISTRSMRIWGKLTAGTFLVSGAQNGWLLSGLLFALPFLRENSVVMVEGTLLCRNEILVTLKALTDAGIKISAQINSQDKDSDSAKKGNYIGAVFKIKGGQQYNMKEIPEIE